MRKIYVTYLDHLGKYRDRLKQIREAIPASAEAIVFTKDAAGESLDDKGGFRIVQIPRGIAYRSIFLQWQLYRRIQGLPRDAAVVVQDWFKNFAVALLLRSRRGGTRYIYSPVISDWGWIWKRFKGKVPSCGLRYDWIRARAALLDRWLCQRCDFLVVQSEELAGFYREAYGLGDRAVGFNYNSHFWEIDAPHVADKQGGALQVGFVGNFEMHKGSREILELARLMSSACRIRIAGGAKGRANVKMLRRAKEMPNVTVEGFLSKGDLKAFFEEIDALVLFSYHEGSPRVVLEFLGYNKPIFLYDNPGIDYCRGMPGVHCFPYGEFHHALPALERLAAGDCGKIRRDMPEALRRNHLRPLLEMAFSHG